MSENDEPPDWVRCYVCEKNLYIAAKRKVKKINGSGHDVLSEIRQLLNGKYTCSDICFGLATRSPSEPSDLDFE